MRKSHIYIITIFIVIIAGCSKKTSIDRSVAPTPKPAPNINIPKPTYFKLDNGLQVFVVEDHKLPSVSFQLTVDNDPILEKNKVGLSNLSGELMGEGTTKRTKEEIDKEIDFIGAKLYTYADGLYLSSLSKHTDKALEIVSDIIMNPSFPEEQLEKKKRKLTSSLKTISTNPQAMASRVSKVLRYGKNHPYGEVQKKEHIENISIEDCKNHYLTYFRPNVSYLVIVGDITIEKAKEQAKKYFGKWEKQDVPKHRYMFPKLPDENRVVFVEKPGAVQSLIQITYPLSYKKGAEDEPEVTLMSSIFGGAFSSYLNANLREDKAYTYGAGGGVSSDMFVGKFSASASVRNEVTDSAIVEFLAEMKRISEEKVSQEDLTRIKNNSNGNFALSLEKSKTIARFALNTARYKLPEDYYQNYLSRLGEVTIYDIQEAAKKYVKPNACIILVIGNKDVLESIKQFDADGIVEQFDYNGEPKRELKPAPNGMTAEKVLEKYFYARTKLNTMSEVKSIFYNIKDITKEMETTIQGMKIKMISKQMQPNAMSMEMKMNNTTMQKQLFDGKQGKSITMKGENKMSEDEVESLSSASVIHKELKYKELGYKLNLLGIENILNKDAYKIEITAPNNDTEIDYFDINSNLLIYSMSISSKNGETTTSTTEYSNYKEVDGILFPHKILEQIGAQLMDLKVTKIKLNSGLKIEDFR